MSSAKDCFAKAYKLRNDSSPDKKCDSLVDMAVLDIANGDYDKALEHLKQAHEQVRILFNRKLRRVKNNNSFSISEPD